MADHLGIDGPPETATIRAGHQILSEIHRGSTRAVYRATGGQAERTVILKTFREGVPTSAALIGLRHEYGILSRLPQSGVARALALVEDADPPVLILEDAPGETLRTLIDRRVLDVTAAVRIAHRLARTLSEIHARRILHRDLNPSNVLVDLASDRVTMIDFSLAVQRSGLSVDEPADSLLEGTIAYMAPEQTGRLASDPDHRADLYSLGITLYEALTGALPFDSEDPLEVVHAHIAGIPVPPAGVAPDVPRTVSDIVMKLLAKNPEERYQSAGGLAADLGRCLGSLEASGDIPFFALAQHDVAGPVRTPQRLYGRKTEIETLIRAYDRASRGETGLLLVSGYAGVGKTALIGELEKRVLLAGGRFIAGKFDQVVRAVPYAALTDAFRDLIRQVLSESETSLRRRRETLLESLGPNAGIITEVIPDLELIVGPQPRVPLLGPTESRNRFVDVFRRFLRTLASPDEALVLFLDDLQWADPASIDLLRAFLSDPGPSGLLVVGAYRENEVDESHPLSEAIRNIETSGTPLERMALRPLDAADLARLVRDALGGATDEANPLSELVHHKTEGNPFFAIQFLKSLGQDELWLDQEAGVWRFDLERIRRMRTTDNVIELLSHRITELPESTRRVLQIAACLGGQFRIESLAAACDTDPESALTDLRRAVEWGLVVPAADGGDAPGGGSLAFLHDRVQQAAYGLIPQSELPAMHLEIGRRLMAGIDSDHREERVFELVDQLNDGIDLIEDDTERSEVARLNCIAGRRAKSSTAYSAALDYFQAAARLLPDDPWTSQYDVAFPLYLDIAESQYLCGRFEDAAGTFQLLIREARTPLDEAEVHILRTAQYENLAHYGEAVAAARDGLRPLGIAMPEPSALEGALEAEIAGIDEQLAGRRIADLAELPSMTDPRVRMCMRLLRAVWSPAYLVGDPGLIAWIPAVMVRLSMKHGNTDQSAFGYIVHGITLGTRRAEYAAGHEFGLLALDLNERSGDVRSRAHVHQLFSCFVNPWRRPLSTCFPHCREAYRSALETGDFAYATYTIFHETWYGLLAGRELAEFQARYAPAIDFLRRIKNHSFADAEEVVLRWGRALQGGTESPVSLSDGDEFEARYVADYAEMPFFRVFYHVARLHLHLAHERFEAAAEEAARAEKVITALSGTIWPVLLCTYRALALAALAGSSATGRRARLVERIRADAEHLELWARNCPENFSHAHLLVSAELAVLQGDAEAAALNDAAVEAAARCGWPIHHGLALQRHARFRLARGEDAQATRSLQAARNVYERWGAAAVSGFLSGELHEDSGPVHAESSISPFVTVQSSTRELDLESVMRAAKAITGELDLDQLLETLMRILLQVAGAQRGVLVLESDSGPYVQAECSIERDRVEVLQPRPLEPESDLPHTILNYVRRTHESLALQDATTDPIHAGDPYIRKTRPRSALCVPVLHQARLLGCVYLEHRLSPRVFTGARTRVIQMLSSHAAIAIANAGLFREVSQLRDRLQAENVYLQEEIRTQHGFDEIIGESPALKRVLTKVEQVAPTGATVLILGETGTGKELLARALHRLSPRGERPLVVVNCGAISAGLVESELFGHEKGAFTGATSRKIGRFELADGGTVFLDEIGDLPPELQVRLLRVLQEGEIERVGGTQTIPVDVRVIAATHRDLEAAVAASEFRSDLYYRLNVFPIRMPPLRDRREDIPLLVRHFVMKDGTRLGRRLQRIPRATMDALVAYAWPGNVRELRNVIERSIITSRGDALELGDWFATTPSRGGPTARTLAETERDHIVETLMSTGWVVSGPRGAARLLGLKPTTLEARMKKLGIVRPGFR